MKRYDDLVAEALTRVKEILPWNLSRSFAAGNKPILLDVREQADFDLLRIPGSINVPRGIWNSPASGITTRPCRNWPPGASRRSWSSAVPASVRCWLPTCCCRWASATWFRLGRPAKMGDTITDARNPSGILPGFKEIHPMVFSGIYPINTADMST